MSVQWRVRRGDKVIVLSGKDKGKAGEILKVDRGCQRVIVKGVGMISRHQKASASLPDGGIVHRESSIHVSSVAHIDPGTGRPTRVGMKRLDDGRKVRYAKRSGDLIDK